MGWNAELKNAGSMLSRWASQEFSTDWGTRDISERTQFYDPISYHQGSVWPLFTGWVSLAEYRTGHPLSGLAHLMQNADLTWAQDLGSVTELLSGEFYQPLGRSSSHQMWSSAMVIAPMLRGLFGVTCEAPSKTIHVNPHLPAEWDHARLRNVALGPIAVDLDFERTRGGKLTVRAVTPSRHKPSVWLRRLGRVASRPCHRHTPWSSQKQQLFSVFLQVFPNKGPKHSSSKLSTRNIQHIKRNFASRRRDIQRLICL